MKLFLFLLLSHLAIGQDFVPGRYIVEFDGEPLASAMASVDKAERSSPRRLAAERARISSHHEKVKSILMERNVKVRGTVDTVANAVVVENTDLEQLQNLPGVKRIRPVRLLKAKMDHVIPLLKIPDAWAKVGGSDQAGAGMKIAIIDTGIDHHHAAFQDPDLKVPDGFPKVSEESNRRYTNNKIIVARSYGTSAADEEGHGTGTSMAAAGVLQRISLGNISGVAPKAWLGNYRASDGSTGNFSVDSLLFAMDDSIKDGFDIINLSIGSAGITLAEDADLTPAINRAIEAGVIVVVAAGNDGPDVSTIGDTASPLNAVAVGSTQNDRILGPALVIPGDFIFATAASNSEGTEAIPGKMVDVSTIDPAGLACTALPAGSLKGSLVLIQRGTCTFREKFNNAEAAGAAGAVVFDNTAGNLISMQVDDATLRGIFITRNAGNFVKDLLAATPTADFVLVFSEAYPQDPNVLSDFSARGPSPDLYIKPDLLTPGGTIVTATNGTLPNQPSSSNYDVVDGTSISAPMVAGGFAVLKQARPGLTPAQYRSLLIN
ncbi:MAG: S8 family serine peptidase, partial [Candidatus Solibacter usitatus]|nr:S8 family serine peptidase [Candidatus Solibacter usitatus]